MVIEQEGSINKMSSNLTHLKMKLSCSYAGQFSSVCIFTVDSDMLFTLKELLVYQYT